MSEPQSSAAAVPTAAVFDMERRRTNAPAWADLPWTPPDGMVRASPRQIIEMLPMPRRMAMHADMHNRSFCVCEIGVAAPNAETEPFDDGSVCVRFNSGLIDFVYCVARALFGGTNWKSQNETHAMVLDIDGVGRELVGIYDQWRRGSLWRNQRVRVDGLTLAAPVAKRAEHLARTALLFLLCHEIGHAVLHADVAPDERTTAQEHEADAYGIDLAVIGYARTTGDERMGIAGALVAIRALTALAVLGHRFPGAHPPPIERLARLRHAMRKMCAGEEAYIHFTTIAYAMEEQMSAAENRIRGLPMATEVSAERLVSRTYASLEECAQDRVSKEAVRAMFLRDVTDASEAVRMRAGAIAARVLATTAPSYRFEPTSPRGRIFRPMVALFNDMRDSLPAEIARFFQTEA